MSAATIRAGTSGYSYKEWKGGFYPEDLASSGFLEFYSQKLSTAVEDLIADFDQAF